MSSRMQSVPDRYYLHHLARLTSSKEVHANEDIKNVAGVKLVGKGTLINRQIQDRLLEHKLLKPIDLSLDIAANIALPEIKADLMQTLEQSDNLRLLLFSNPQLESLKESLGSLPLGKVLSNKLTVMKYCLPNQYEHSLLVTLTSLFIGKVCQFSEADLELLALIGLCHDIGVLHIEPSLLSDEHIINLTEWRQIQAHPIIGFMILESQQTLPGTIAQAVLQHHERMDGSGYPQHLKGNQIHRFGRLVAVAEIVMGICQKASMDTLVTILKTNINQVDTAIVDQLTHALYRTNLIGLSGRVFSSTIPVEQSEMTRTLQMAEAITAIFAYWKTLNLDLDLEIYHIKRLNQRMNDICLGLDRAGIVPLNATGSIQQYCQDFSSFIEAKSLLRETVYQLKNILRVESQRLAEQIANSSQLGSWFSFLTEQLQSLKELA